MPSNEEEISGDQSNLIYKALSLTAQMYFKVLYKRGMLETKCTPFGDREKLE